MTYFNTVTTRMTVLRSPGWHLLMCSLEPSTCPWNTQSGTKEERGHRIHSPTALALHFSSLFPVLFYICCASNQSHFLSYFCSPFIIGFDTCHHSPGHTPVFPGQVGLLPALGASGCLVQISLVFVLVLGFSNLSSKCQAYLVSGTRRVSAHSNLTCLSQDPLRNLPPVKSFLCYSQLSKWKK